MIFSGKQRVCWCQLEQEEVLPAQQGQHSEEEERLDCGHLCLTLQYQCLYRNSIGINFIKIKSNLVNIFLYSIKGKDSKQKKSVEYHHHNQMVQEYLSDTKMLLFLFVYGLLILHNTTKSFLEDRSSWNLPVVNIKQCQQTSNFSGILEG